MNSIAVTADYSSNLLSGGNVLIIKRGAGSSGGGARSSPSPSSGRVSSPSPSSGRSGTSGSGGGSTGTRSVSTPVRTSGGGARVSSSRVVNAQSAISSFSGSSGKPGSNMIQKSALISKVTQTSSPPLTTGTVVSLTGNGFRSLNKGFIGNDGYLAGERMPYNRFLGSRSYNRPYIYYNNNLWYILMLQRTGSDYEYDQVELARVECNTVAKNETADPESEDVDQQIIQFCKMSENPCFVGESNCGFLMTETDVESSSSSRIIGGSAFKAIVLGGLIVLSNAVIYF
jgi:hypothetical protein